MGMYLGGGELPMGLYDGGRLAGVDFGSGPVIVGRTYVPTLGIGSSRSAPSLSACVGVGWMSSTSNESNEPKSGSRPCTFFNDGGELLLVDKRWEGVDSPPLCLAASESAKCRDVPRDMNAEVNRLVSLAKGFMSECVEWFDCERLCPRDERFCYEPEERGCEKIPKWEDTTYE
jgi:hypothetical protein